MEISTSISITSFPDSFAPNVFHLADQTNDSALLTFSITIGENGEDEKSERESLQNYLAITRRNQHKPK